MRPPHPLNAEHRAARRAAGSIRPLLAIDTSTELGGVAVGSGERLLAEVVVGVRSRHSESLLPAIDFALTSAGVEIRDLVGVVVAAGPGSFTGVRIGAATAKGMVRAMGVPLFAYSSLEALATSLSGLASPVCAMFDARRGEVYAGCYAFAEDGGREVVLSDRAEPVEAIVDRLAELSPVYVGEGAVRYREAIERLGGRVAPSHLAVPRAGALIRLAQASPEAGRIDEPMRWEPEYVRAAGVEREARR